MRTAIYSKRIQRMPLHDTIHNLDEEQTGASISFPSHRINHKCIH